MEPQRPGTTGGERRRPADTGTDAPSGVPGGSAYWNNGGETAGTGDPYGVPNGSAYWNNGGETAGTGDPYGVPDGSAYWNSGTGRAKARAAHGEATDGNTRARRRGGRAQDPNPAAEWHPGAGDPDETVLIRRWAGRWRPATPIQQVLVLTGRSLRLAFSDRKLVFFGLLQPVVLLLLFSQVFSGIGTLPGVAEYNGYINYLLPATLVTIALTTAVGAGVGLLTEVFTGFIGRLRAMPLTLGAVLFARTLADSVRLALSLTAATVIAVPVLGFRPGSIVGLALGLLLSIVVGWGLSWLFIAIACWQPKPEAMQAASFIVMVPLMFGSSAYLPLEVMPTWVRWFSSVNPVTYAVDAVRALSLDRPAGWSPVLALALAGAAAVGGAAWAFRLFRRAT
ncbi:ABC transporter permease [Actinokineospora soli]|uniref:Transport permease protein n=1 Tax=Actinokineospora soli TaxID=1048753 RepID=A0ABW2TNK9_9PSEU